MSLSISLLLAGVAFLASGFTAMVGIGGGVMLVAVMATLMPVSLLVPLHGVSQLASNASRVACDPRHVQWPLVRAFVLGLLPGLLLGLPLAGSLSETAMQLSLGGFILITTWLPQLLRLPGNFLGLGALQGLLTPVLGATGVLNGPFLLRQGLARDAVAVTQGMMMSILGLSKTLSFAVMGFAFGRHLLLLVLLCVGVMGGSWAGTRLRKRLHPQKFYAIFKVAVTLLGLRLLLAPWL